MREIIDDVFTWALFSEPHGYNFNGYLIRHADGNICIDPVKPSEGDLAQLTRAGVSRILITNRNHSRAANEVRQATGARTGIHPADALHARREGAEIDDELKAGERIGPLLALGVPGKSPGELAFFWPERRILVVGDAVVGDPPGALKLLREAVIDDMSRLRESVRKLLDLDFDVLLTGDGEAILEGAKGRLRELVETFPE